MVKDIEVRYNLEQVVNGLKPFYIVKLENLSWDNAEYLGKHSLLHRVFVEGVKERSLKVSSLLCRTE